MRQARGFTLIEVLVALIIIGVGMLGLAKIQGLSYGSTATASQRSIAAFEAASLAAAMHANRNYWSNLPANLVITVAGAVITSSDATLAAASDCTLTTGATPCAAANVAAYDLQQWVADLNKSLPNVVGTTINCPASVATAPTTCLIQVAWAENQTGINVTSAGQAGVAAAPYTLYVVP